MGWQDRDYARHDASGRHAIWRPAMATGLKMSTILIAINVGVFVVDALSQGALFMAGATIPKEVLHGQVWRLLTSVYLHANPMHLFLNMLGLYFLGPYLERAWGPRRFLLIYHACGLAGSLTYVLLASLGWLRDAPLIGASGAVLGVLAACAVLFPGIQLIVFVFPMRIRTAAGLFMGLYLLNVLNKGQNAGGDAAHIGGLAVGGLYAMYARRGGIGGWSMPRLAMTLRRPQPGAWQEKLEDERQDEETIDRILAKIHEYGIESLSAEEQEALASASRRQQAREEQYGRTDRL